MKNLKQLISKFWPVWIRFQKQPSEEELLMEEALSQLEQSEKKLKKQQAEFEEQLMQNEEMCLDLYEENENLKLENQILKSRIQELLQHSQRPGKPLLERGGEIDKYEGEIHDLIISCLRKQLHSVKPHSRRFDILQDVIKNNPESGHYERFLQKLDKLFIGYSGINQKVNNELKKMGLEIIVDGNHNKVKFIDDARYKSPFSKSPSDRRTGNNIIKQLKQELF